MLYQYVTAGYSATNLVLALIIYFKAPRSAINKFYLFLVGSMFVLGGCGLAAQAFSCSIPLTWSAEAVASFLFSVFPFFFLHFIVVLVRREDLLESKIVILFIYFAGLFSYTIQLIGLLPKPVASSTGFTSIGFIFFVTWMSILFSVGVAILFTFLKGFSDRGVRSNIIVSGFALLLFFLPGPFSESIFVALGPGQTEWYFISSLFALVVALYFVFRHKIIINTVYDLMKSALDVMSDIFLRMDEDLFIKMVRGASQGVLGYSEKELLGRSLTDIVSPPDQLINYKRSVLSGGKKDLTTDAEMLGRDGKRVDVSLSLTPVIDTGKLVGFVGVARDFTEKRNAERLESAISKIFEVSAHAQNLHDLGKEIYSIVKSVIDVENFYIALKDDATGEITFPFFIDRYYEQPDQQTSLYKLTKHVIHDGQPALLTSSESSTTEKPVHDNGFSKYPATWLGVPLKTSRGVFGVVAVYTYLTSTSIGEREKSILTLFSQQASTILDRKHAEMKIREQAALLDEVLDAIILESLDGQILYWNKGASKIYGYESSAVIGKNSYDILHSEPPEAVFRVRDNLLEKNRWSGELKFVKKEGELVILDNRWTLLTDEGGNPRAILKVSSDISEKKKMEEQFFRMQRMDGLGRLAGGIAHDIRDLLTPITMSVDALRKRLDDEQSLKILRLVDASARRSVELVKQILVFSRGEDSDRIVFQPTSIIHEMETMIRETFPKSIQVEFEIAENLWAVYGDAIQLRQVILNLCINSRDAMPDGGKLFLKAENLAMDENGIRIHPDARPGRYVVFTISDTGSGIPPGLFNKIFEPFFTTKEVTGGAGLGLPTAAAIVRSHGGFVTLHSEVRKGTTFKIYIPAADVAEHAPVEEKDLDVLSGHGELILVVDDESSIREITRVTLETYGYSVMTAIDGAEAIATYARNADRIKVILLDNMMPVLDGRSAIMAIRKMQTGVKIIAASGLEEEGQSTFSITADAFLSKPFTAEALLVTVRKVLEGLPETS